MQKTRLTILLSLLLAACVAGGYLWYLGDRSTFGPRTVLSDAPAAVGGPFSLVDQNGQRRTDKDFQGKFMLVFFGYTYCPDVCPTTLAIISAALDKLGPAADLVVPVFISIDPKRDTPAMLKSYLSAFGPRFVGLTGSDKEVAAAAKAYRVYFQTHAGEKTGEYTLDHSSVIYLINPRGVFTANYTLEAGPDAMATDLRKQIAASR